MHKNYDELNEGQIRQNSRKVSTFFDTKATNPSASSPKSTIFGRQKQQYPPSLLATFEDFLEIPKEPIDLPRVLVNATSMFDFYDEIKAYYPSSDLDMVLAQGKELATNILEDPLLEANLKDCNPKSQKLPRLWGLYTSNPMYVAIWACPEAQPYRIKYLALLGHIALAAFQLKSKRTEPHLRHDFPVASRHQNRIYVNAIYCAVLALRKLADEENLYVLPTLPDLGISPKELIPHLENTGSLLYPIQILLKYFLEEKNPPQRTTSTNEQTSKSTHRPKSPSLVSPATHKIIPTNPDPAQAAKTPKISLTQLPTQSVKDLEKMEASGLAPTEFQSRVEMVACECQGTEPTAGKSPRQQATQAHQIKKRLAMVNQLLPTAYELPNLYEVSNLLAAIGDLFRQGPASKYLPEGIHPFELGAFLSTMFWLSSPLDEIIDLRLYHRPPTYPDPKRGLLLYGSDPQSVHRCLWLVKPATPKRKILPSALQRSYTRPVKDHFYLNSGQGIENVFCKYIDKIGAHSSGRLFPHALEYYQSAADHFLKMVNVIHFTRWTSPRLSDYMFHWVEKQKGSDLTCAMYLFGKEHFLGINPSYYTNTSVRDLQHAYHESCAEILALHAEEQGTHFDKKPAISLPLTSHSDHVGSPFCPTSSAVRGLARHLQATLKEAKKLPVLTVEKLLRVHNSMVRYTAFLVAFSTGYRGVREPIMLPSEYHMASRFAVFGDKNAGDSYKDRTMWIPQVCLEQLRLFWAHVALVHERLQALCPDIYYLTDSPRGADKAGILFLRPERDGSVTWRKVSPGFLMKNLDGVYPLPFNSGRHYLRSHLLRNKCPLDVIDAYMNHYERGQEPFGRYSALPSKLFRRDLEKHLDPLLEADGWVPMSGLEL